MVARKLDGCSVSLARRSARLSPAAASFASLLSFIVITAISAQAKSALKNINTSCSKNNQIKGLSDKTNIPLFNIGLIIGRYCG